MGGGGSGGGAKAPKELLLHAGDPGSTHSPRESREQSRRQKGRKKASGEPESGHVEPPSGHCRVAPLSTSQLDFICI